MTKKSILIFLLICISIFIFGEETGSLSLSILPGGIVPFGDSTSYFTAGVGAGVSADLRLNSLPLLFFKLDTSYSYIPIRTKDGVSVYSATAGGGFNFNLIKKLNLAAYGTGGYFYSSLNDGSGDGGGNISLKGGLSVSYAFLPSFSLLGDVHYLYNFYLNQGLGLSIGASYTLPLQRRESTIDTRQTRPELLEATTNNKTGAGLIISSIKLDRIFPVLFKHYDDNSVGKVLIFQ